MRVAITGGCGFIGTNLAKMYDSPLLIDKLTYASTLSNNGLVFADICDGLEGVLDGVDLLIHLAAETHVDRSIEGGDEFVRTNVLGTKRVLDAALQAKVGKVVHVSTDEVYGDHCPFPRTEWDAFSPSSPYAASKAAGDLMAQAYYRTYGLPVVIVRPTNNFGPYQHPEKMLPLFIWQAMNHQPLPIYGDGEAQRDWLYVEDCCRAIQMVAERGAVGQAYNIGADHYYSTLEMAQSVISRLGGEIRFIQDRAGHDRQYIVQWLKLEALGWQPSSFDLNPTIDWYVNNRQWMEEKVKGSADYFTRKYGGLIWTS